MWAVVQPARRSCILVLLQRKYAAQCLRVSYSFSSCDLGYLSLLAQHLEGRSPECPALLAHRLGFLAKVTLPLQHPALLAA